ncbi:MAG TPA: VOC family protein [Pyrinomonadaceae bacterium]|jgi:catechol 2,3-dioxygenase-like lactoylglutathione lyase family enzyme|nr:VOC family protein [Pyrinomonadaceae bacterium]
MTIQVTKLSHVNITVPPELEEVTKQFYAAVMEIREVPKPPELKARGGAWYQLGEVQLHLSREQRPPDNHASKRHVCYAVRSLSEAEQHFRAAGIEVIPDNLPIPGSPRFYVRDPAGNLLEIAEG